MIATHAHDGQFDKAGMPYILHPLRVSEAVRHLGEKFQVVAVLHDVVEDTDITLEQIYEEFGEAIGKGVRGITKREKIGGHESYREYLDRVRGNRLALQVKLADMNDNSRPERLAFLSVEKQVRLASKYARGRHYLLTGEWYDNENLDKVIKAGYKK